MQCVTVQPLGFHGVFMLAWSLISVKQLASMHDVVDVSTLFFCGLANMASALCNYALYTNSASALLQVCGQ